MSRINYSTGSPWEPIIGYSRAVRVGSILSVSGTTATGADGKIVGGDDIYAQTKQALSNIAAALQLADVPLDRVIRTRIFTADISQWEQIGRAHGEVFSEIRPATTMVEVKALISPEMLIEIEADAVVE